MVVGEMHLNGITGKVLAVELGWNEKYLSQVLNSSNPPKNSQKKVTDALKRIIQRKAAGAATEKGDKIV